MLISKANFVVKIQHYYKLFTLIEIFKQNISKQGYLSIIHKFKRKEIYE
tara:strand:+ start:154 stop:300 length:147 start_codon:yes stop_codon:yes gene_type:complete